MKLKTKKIIAREFLALLLVLSIGLTVFFCVYSYNAYKENKINNLFNDVNITAKQIKEINELEYSKLSNSQQLDLTIKTILISFIIVFGLRYLIYGVKWSLRTLKEKEQ
jgi:hypothetical protein